MSATNKKNTEHKLKTFLMDPIKLMLLRTPKIVKPINWTSLKYYTWIQ